MRFIGVEVEQETSAPPPKKKSWIRPCISILIIIIVFIIMVIIFIIIIAILVVADHFTFLGNCPPTPPLSQHFALSKN